MGDFWVAKISKFFLECLVDAGSEPTYVEKIESTPPPLPGGGGGQDPLSPSSRSAHIVLCFIFQTIGLRIIHLLSRDNSNLPFLKYLTKKQCNLNASTLHNKTTALLIAVALEQTDIIKHLIEHGAEVNKGEGPIHRIAPLILAALRQKKGSFEALLTSKTIDLDIVDSASGPLLYICARLLPIDCMKRLLEAGANPNITDKYGRTPLLLCGANRQHDLMKLLIEHGADVNKRDAAQNVPMLRSVQTGSLTHFCLIEHTFINVFSSPEPNAQGELLCPLQLVS